MDTMPQGVVEAGASGAKQNSSSLSPSFGFVSAFFSFHFSAFAFSSCLSAFFGFRFSLKFFETNVFLSFSLCSFRFSASALFSVFCFQPSPFSRRLSAFAFSAFAFSAFAFQPLFAFAFQTSLLSALPSLKRAFICEALFTPTPQLLLRFLRDKWIHRSCALHTSAGLLHRGSSPIPVVTSLFSMPGCIYLPLLVPTIPPFPPPFLPLQLLPLHHATSTHRLVDLFFHLLHPPTPPTPSSRCGWAAHSEPPVDAQGHAPGAWTAWIAA